MMMRGLTRVRRLWTLRMKCLSMASVISKSAMTPSFIGLMATMLPGVRPNIIFASLPTASTLLLPRPSLLTATTDGSLKTIPLPFIYTSVFAVPRSMARSFENNPRMGSKSIAFSSLLDSHTHKMDFIPCLSGGNFRPFTQKIKRQVVNEGWTVH